MFLYERCFFLFPPAARQQKNGGKSRQHNPTQKKHNLRICRFFLPPPTSVTDINEVHRAIQATPWIIMSLAPSAGPSGAASPAPMAPSAITPVSAGVTPASGPSVAAKDPASMGGAGGQRSSHSRHSQNRPRNRPLHDNIPTVVSRERQEAIVQARRARPAFVMTPADREASRLSRSGRPLSELEILQEKHEPEFKQIVPIIADALTSVVQQHQVYAKTVARDERFAHYETNTVPGILIEDYVHRIAEYTYISPTTLVVTLIFLDRLCDRYPSLLVTQLNVFKLFFVAARVASKVNDLRTLNNKHFASVGGISNKHLNELEARFLIDLRFDLFVSPRDFMVYGQKIAPPTMPLFRTPSSGAVARVRGLTSATAVSARDASEGGDTPGQSMPLGNSNTEGSNLANCSGPNNTSSGGEPARRASAGLLS